MSNNSFGGAFTVTLGDGRRIKARGQFTNHPTTTTVTTEKNLDGSFARVVALRNAKVEMELELADGVTAADLLAYEGNLTIVETKNSRTHLYTDGCFTGEPSEDVLTGKTTGVAFEAVSYRKL
jgi:hypothetical protein